MDKTQNQRDEYKEVVVSDESSKEIFYLLPLEPLLFFFLKKNNGILGTGFLVTSGFLKIYDFSIFIFRNNIHRESR